MHFGILCPFQAFIKLAVGTAPPLHLVAGAARHDDVAAVVEAGAVLARVLELREVRDPRPLGQVEAEDGVLDVARAPQLVPVGDCIVNAND